MVAKGGSELGIGFGVGVTPVASGRILINFVLLQSVYALWSGHKSVANLAVVTSFGVFSCHRGPNQ